jgi:hypothetical protein
MIREHRFLISIFKEVEKLKQKNNLPGMKGMPLSYWKNFQPKRYQTYLFFFHRSFPYNHHRPSSTSPCSTGGGVATRT